MKQWNSREKTGGDYVVQSHGDLKKTKKKGQERCYLHKQIGKK